MAKLIGTKEAAKMLGISPRHVRRLLKEGKLTGQKVGRDWVMPNKEVMRIEEHN